MIDAILRRIYRYGILVGYKLLIPYKVVGWENLPDYDDGPYVLVSNHFSYFEAPLLTVLLFNKNFRAMAASETAGEFGLIRSLYRAYEDYLILVQRGRIDRQSIHAGLKALREGMWVFLHPEGGVTEEAVRLASLGQATDHLGEGYHSRVPAVLLPARPGAAFLATQTNAKILPIAFWGTEHVEANLTSLRRTKITMKIGEPFKPMPVPDGVRGRERRAYFDAVGDKIMSSIAELMPEHYHGSYSR